MSDQSSTETDKTDERLNEAFDQLETPTEPKTASSGIGPTLAIFIALIAVGVASYPAYELYRQGTSASEMATEIEQRTVVFEATQATMRDDLANLGARLDELSAELAEDDTSDSEFRKFVSGELDAVRGSLGTSSQDWLFAEVEYLVRMANQRVLMEGDAASALTLLQSADQIVQDAEGLTAHALRQALANDVAALKAVNMPDVQGIYLELSALIRQVDSLKRSVPGFEPEEIKAPPPVEAQTLLQQSLAFMANAADRFLNLVDFRRGDVDVKPILAPREEYYLRQNLILKLQIAQMALLEASSEVFRSSIAEAHEWVAASFDADDAATVAMVDSLSRLGEQEVGSSLPDISNSLKAARNLLADFHEVAD